MADNFVYVPAAAALDADLTLSVPSLGEKAALLAWYGETLGAPDYARPNWDSFEEWLRDLSWVEPRRVALFHPGMPLTDDAPGRTTYLSILDAAVLDWRDDPRHDLVVGFHPDWADTIARLLA